LSKRAKRRAEEPEPVADVGETREGTAATDPSEAAEEPSPEVEGVEARIAELETELARVRDEVEEASGRALRILAEFDTYRRRTERERGAAEERGASEVLRELLEVADNFDRALEHAGDGVPAAFVDGMRLVARSLHDVLDRRGVRRIDAVGTEFDPALHEALTSLPDAEAEPNTVLSEVQPGYRLGEKVLRPAKVIVSRAESE